jgi:hypothetical protein
MSVWQTIDKIIGLVETEDDRSRETEFLAFLDKLAWQISEIEPTDSPVGREMPEEDYSAIRKAAEQSFPNWGFYNVAGQVTGNIGSSEVLVGDAIDDVADIINDLKMVFWSYQNESEEIAIWHLLDSYANHWRGHMRSLQFYVLCLETQQ